MKKFHCWLFCIIASAVWLAFLEYGASAAFLAAAMVINAQGLKE